MRARMPAAGAHWRTGSRFGSTRVPRQSFEGWKPSPRGRLLGARASCPRTESLGTAGRVCVRGRQPLEPIGGQALALGQLGCLGNRSRAGSPRPGGLLGARASSPRTESLGTAGRVCVRGRQPLEPIGGQALALGQLGCLGNRSRAGSPRPGGGSLGRGHPALERGLRGSDVSSNRFRRPAQAGSAIFSSCLPRFCPVKSLVKVLGMFSKPS